MTAAMKERRIEVASGIWIEMPDAPWNARDREAMFVLEKIGADDWAVKYRHLKKTAVPGPWRHENAPYLRGILKLGTAKGVVELVVKKAVQMGVSEALRTLFGYWATFDPEPIGLALPNKDKGKEIVENEIIPLFMREFALHRDLKPLLPKKLHDMKKGQIRLANDFLLHLMWAGSPSSMASNPMKRAACDEVDKFQAWAGNDADPVSLIEMRMTTYPDRLLLLISTPTNALGMISIRFDQCRHKLYYLVPCPHCGVRQRLVFGEGGAYGVKWSERVRALAKEGRPEEAAALVFEEGVHYQCCACHGLMDERQKREAVRAGTWGTVREDGLLSDGMIADAEEVEEWPTETRLGLQVSSLYCCWESWTMAHLAAEFLKARTLQQKYAFRTSRLGETWADSVEKVHVELIDERAAAATLEEGVVPKWAARLIATVDTQKDYFWMVLRAWGPGMRSQRVWHNQVKSFEEIEQWCFRTAWKNEDPRLMSRTVDKVLIDSGGTRKFDLDEQLSAEGAVLPSRVMDVYAWGLKHQAMVKVIKGDARPEQGLYIRKGRGEYVHDREKKPVELWLLDVHHFQDQLADLMGQSVEVADYKTGEVLGKAPVWALNKRVDAEYHRHLSNMHKVTRPGPRGTSKMRWEPKREGLRVDYRACEGYQVAGAFMTGVHVLPDMPHWMASIEAGIEQRAARGVPSPRLPVIQTPDGRAFVASMRD